MRDAVYAELHSVALRLFLSCASAKFPNWNGCLDKFHDHFPSLDNENLLSGLLGCQKKEG